MVKYSRAQSLFLKLGKKALVKAILDTIDMGNKEGKVIKSKKSVEILHHFSCGKCKKWWSIGDATKDKKEWFCPWCGEGNMYE